MKHKLILFILSASLFCLAGGNLLQNGDFNGNDLLADIMVQQNDGQVKVSKVTEELSWNQCVKMEITAFKEMDGKKLYLDLKEKGILVRHFDTPKIANYNRITIGTMEQMEALLQEIKAILEVQT